ncbi:MAG: autotransporter-associated beta strand repeat-containing protein [Pirellulales bacterium]|nr:autotransporter-associated beta strand repeat-containing protein [Pirellulales bacterium]
MSFLLGLLSLLIPCQGVFAATWTWDAVGLPGSVWTTNGQWTTTGSPDLTEAVGAEDLLFSSSSNTTVYANLSAETAKSCTFDASAPAYTFTRTTLTSDSLQFNSYPTTSSSDIVWTNNSSFTQTYYVPIKFGNGIVNLGSLGGGGGISFKTEDNGQNGGSYLYCGYGTVADRTITFNGPGTAYFSGDLKGGYGNTTLLLNTDITVDGRWTWSNNANVGTIYKDGLGTLTLNGNTYGSATLCNRNMSIKEGAVRVYHIQALGNTDTNSIILPGGEYTGRLELATNTSSSFARRITLEGRDYTNLAAQVLNVENTSHIGKSVFLSPGPNGMNYNFESTSGLLEIAPNLDQDNAGLGVLNFSGAGDFSMQGNIIESGSGVAAIRKYGSGTLTLYGAGNTFTGPLVVNGGTVTVDATSSIGTASAYHIGGGTLDVSAVGGLTPYIGTTLSGSGTVIGNVTINTDATLEPGNTDDTPSSSGITFSATPGTLTLQNDLTVNGGTLRFDLDGDDVTAGSGVNDLISVDNLSLWSGTIDIHMLEGSLTTDTYRLINYTGSLLSGVGSVSYLTLTGVSSGGSRQNFALDDSVDHQINLVVTGEDPKHLTWVGDGSANKWNHTVQNWNDGLGADKFYNGDFVVFNDSGSNSPAVDIEGTVAPATVTVNNPTKDYTFGGTGAVDSSGGLTKEGAATLTIANDGPNTFGGIQLTAGTIVFNQGVDSELPDAISGSGSLRKEGTNVLTLSGMSTGFTGPITVVSGTLKAGNNAALGDATAGTVVEDGATLDGGGMGFDDEPITVQGAGVGGNGALINTGINRADLHHVEFLNDTTVGGTGTIDRTEGLLSLDHQLLGNHHDLTKVGTNTVQISEAGETNFGDIFVNEGNLTFDADSTMGDQTKTVTVANNAILSFYNTSATHEKPIVIDATGGQVAGWHGSNTVDSTITMNGNLTLLSNDDTLTLNGPLTGDGNLNRDNIPGYTAAGVVYLVSDNNNYTGATTITSGRLAVGKGGMTGSLGGTGDITLGDNGTLHFYRQGTMDVTRDIVGTGLSSEAVRYGSTSYNFRDTVYNVSGDNTYTGDTWVYGGTVVLSNGTGLGTADGKTVINNSVGFPCVALTGDISVAENFELQPRGNYALVSAVYAPHIESLSGNNTLTGTIGTGTGGGGSVYTISSAGTGGGDLLTISGDVVCERPNASCTLRLLGPGKGEVSGAITCLTDCNWTNVNIVSGEWTFSNVNTYTGPTNVLSDSTLKLTGSGSIMDSSAITVESAAVLDASALTTLQLGSSQVLIGSGTVKVTTLTGPYASPYISPSGTGTPSEQNLPGGTMTVQGDVDFDYTSFPTLQFKLADDDASAQNDKIVVTGNVTMSSAQVVIIPGTSLETNVDYTLLTAANDFSTSSFFTLGYSYTRYDLSLDTSTPGELKLHVGYQTNKSLTWTATGDTADWDVIGQYNWKDNVDNPEAFYQADFVTFDDSVPDVARTVNLTATVYPALITVDSDLDYTIEGAGKISSDTGIVKQGAGRLTIATANDFNGTVSIFGGTVRPTKSRGLGNDGGDIVIDGGTLDMYGFYTQRRKYVSLQGTGASGDGAIVNNHAAQSSGINPYLYYVTLTGDATIGGTNNWSIEGNPLPGSNWAPGYLHGNGHALTKAGICEVTLGDLGTTNLGDVTVMQGSLALSGNTDLGATGNLWLNGGTLSLVDSTVAQTKPMTVDLVGIIHNRSGDGELDGDGVLNDNLIVIVGNESTLTLGGSLSGTGGLSLNDIGRLILSGANTYEGDTHVYTGTLELVAGGDIDPDSLITNEADLEVTSGAHTVGVITGTGTTTVLGSASLTASSITQGTLVIGGGGGTTAVAPVPEPGTWILLLIGLVGFAGWRKVRSK